MTAHESKETLKIDEVRRLTAGLSKSAEGYVERIVGEVFGCDETLDDSCPVIGKPTESDVCRLAGENAMGCGATRKGEVGDN